jgi:hypothetical protein
MPNRHRLFNPSTTPRLKRAVVRGALCAAFSFAVAPGLTTAQGKSESSPWERVGVYEGRTLYVDHTTARKSGSRIQIFAITDLKEPNATARGRQYLSKKALLEFDCNQRTLKILQDTWYTRQMGQGEPVFQTEGKAQEPYPVQSDSLGELFWKGACGRR